ncbi:uncharacterized protein LTR77_001501 [Saxophila tyrrhenica]|uniref:FAD-binding domain-containing protein n=1 Tax=Saxophila tyrrhenica TaxID=1690608 RepID=A0AAV9PKZ5_9PEZI|nr:hypothetical protein LTR77_001501 [Saxophila tyrrhenica]
MARDAINGQVRRPHVAVLGAGIGGLAVAIALIKRGVPVTVYEAAENFSPVGAGIGLGPNSLLALDLINPQLRSDYEKASTGNERVEFQNSVFDVMYAEEGFGESKKWSRGLVGAPYFSRSSAHRKDLLEIMKSFIPDGTVEFSKCAEYVQQSEDAVEIRFKDGETVIVDALIGADGIKGMTRRVVLGKRWPDEVAAKYCHTYIYRGILPMSDAKAILGDHAGDAKWFLAKDKTVAIYPISKGREENFVFFVADRNDWTGLQEAKSCSREEMVADLAGFDQRLLKLLDFARPLRWPVYHHPDTPSYYNGRVCLLGDVAHASSPGQAAGAGQGLEDAVVLAHLMSLVQAPEHVSSAFEVYDGIRRPRAQKVVRTSLEAGDMYAWNDASVGADMQRIVDNANQRLHWIWQHPLPEDVQRAENEFVRLVI